MPKCGLPQFFVEKGRVRGLACYAGFSRTNNTKVRPAAALEAAPVRRTVQPASARLRAPRAGSNTSVRRGLLSDHLLSNVCVWLESLGGGSHLSFAKSTPRPQARREVPLRCSKRQTPVFVQLMLRRCSRARRR